ncbi:MAG: CBS domain-containing protein [Candidatus Marinimicrobia bacterium]|nr:CBS domain-containing protein [Candidatus Neomarinimicrobiota bacterium]
MVARDMIKKKGSEVFSITKNDRICEGLSLMNKKNIGALIVMDNDEIQGIVSERDILRFYQSTSCSDIVLKINSSVKISEIMTTSNNLITGQADCDINTLMDKMADNHIRHIPILEKDKLIGMVSMRDVVKAILFVEKRKKRILEEYITSSY